MLRQRQHRLFSPTQIPAPVWAARLGQGDLGGFTVARATTGTYFDANGILQTAAINAARFEHDPATGRALGLLVEESRTNWLTYSEDFRNTADAGSTRPWVYTNTTLTPDARVAPDNAATADKVVEAVTVAIAHRNDANTPALSAGTTYTTSRFVSAAERFRLRLSGSTAVFGSAAQSDYRLDTGTAYSIGASANAATVVPVSASFSRCSLTHTATVSSAATTFFTLLDGAGLRDYIGDGTSGMYVWGAQFEAGSYPLSYIPTTAASVTRAADSASQAFTPAAQSTLLVAFKAPIGMTATGTRTLLQMDDGTANNRIRIETVTGALRAVFTSGGVDQAALNLGTLTSFSFYKLALGWRNGDFAACLNGGQVVTAPAGGTVPGTNTMRAGHDHVPANHWNGAVGDILYWDGRLSNQQLREMSRV